MEMLIAKIPMGEFAYKVSQRQKAQKGPMDQPKCMWNSQDHEYKDMNW